MDFKSELEQQTQSIQTRVKAELQAIHQLQASIVNLEENIASLQIDIDKINKQFAPQIRAITEKKELIAQWKEAIFEHENTLRANEMLLKLQKDIQKNHSDFTRALDNLSRQKADILTAIQAFHEAHPYMSPDTDRTLHAQLTQQQHYLDSTIAQIEYLTQERESLNVIVQIFLKLLYSWEWRTDPLADEQKKLLEITEDILQISESLSQYQDSQEQLEELHEQKKLVLLEEELILHEKETVEELDRTKQAITQSKQTMKGLQKQITQTTQECDTLQRAIGSKSLKSKLAAQREFISQKIEKTQLLQEKSLELSQLDNPARIKLKTDFQATLLNTLSHQEHYQQEQQTYRSSHKVSKFFKPAVDVTSFTSLARIQQGIDKFKKGVEPNSQEARLLGSITTKLMLWQMAEDTNQATRRPIQDRLEAHKAFSTEITALIADLPVDNPLHGATHYLEALTTPVVFEEPSIRSSARGTRK